MQRFAQTFSMHIYRMLIKSLKAKIINKFTFFVACCVVSILLSFLPSSFAGYREIEPGLDIEKDINWKNKKRLYNLFNKSVLRPLTNGEPITIEVGKILTADGFFRSKYCYQIGDYILSGSINLPTWCNQNYGPLRKIRLNPNALIVPVTVKLDHHYSSNAFNLLENQLRARTIGTLRHAKYSLGQLSDYSFRVESDLMLGVVNEKMNKMQLYQLDGFDTQIDDKFDSEFTNIKSKDHEIRIDLLGPNGRSKAGLNVTRNGYSCKNHFKCISKISYHLEFTALDYSPKLLRHETWGLITNSIFPPYYLFFNEENGFKKIFLSRSFLLVLDLDFETRHNILGVNVNIVSP